MEKGATQSCWVQRLNPACQTQDFEVEETTKSSHVWTHFSKDFSSCSKRLQKAHHHTRSSSWPPNERTTKCSPPPDLKLTEPVGIKKQYLLSRAALQIFKEDDFCVPFQDVSESSDFCLKTGNLFSNHNSSCKSVSTLESLVPCSHAARTCDKFYKGESKGKGKLKSAATQHSQWPPSDSASDVRNLAVFRKPCFKPKLNEKSRSFLEVGSAGLLGDAPCNGKNYTFELARSEVCIRGSSPDEVIGTSLSPALTGASADADDRLCMFRYLSRPSTVSKNRPAVRFGDAENKMNEAQLGVALKKYPGQVCGKAKKVRRNFGFLHVVGQSKGLNQSQANPCVRKGSCNVGCSEKFGVHDRGSGVSMISKSIQMKHNGGLGAFATNVGPSITKKFCDLQLFNTECRYTPAVADHPRNLKEDLIAKLPLTRVSSGDLIRPIGRETSLDEYWVQRFEDSAPQGCIRDECHQFNISSTKNFWKPDEKEKSKSFPHPHSHIPLNTNEQFYNSRNVPQQTQLSQRSSFIQTKQTGLGHAQGASAPSNFFQGTSILRTLQEESLQGGMRRLAPKTDKKELFCADGRITEPPIFSEAWIQRWRSSSNLTAVSKSPSLGMDKGLGSAPAKHPVFTSCKGDEEMDYFGCSLQQPGRRTSKLHMGGSAGHYDSALGAYPRGAFPVYGSHASLRSKYITPPSVEAMAIMGNTAGKPHTTAVQNRGSFSVWPCPSNENSQEKRLLEPRETVEDNMLGADMDDLMRFSCY